MAQSSNKDAFFEQRAELTRILTPEEARQGVVSGRIRLVLAGSLILAALAGVIVYSAI